MRLDLVLLDTLAGAHPEWVLVLLGEVDRSGCGEALDRLSGRSNVRLLPPAPGDAVADYVRSFDLGLLPYRLTQETTTRVRLSCTSTWPRAYRWWQPMFRARASSRM